MSSRRMAPYKWNINRHDRKEHQQAAVEHDEANGDTSSTIEYTVKLLLPSQTARSISSRNESNVSWMFNKFGSDVRLSRSDDFYPNTSYRICMIVGKKKSIRETLQWILTIHSEFSDGNGSVTMLVPKTSLGTLINRGYGMQELREKGLVDIHVPEYNPNCVLREVCTTIAGKNDNVINTITTIASIMLTDQFRAVCRNISYEEINMYLKFKKRNNNLIQNFPTLMPTKIGMENYQQQNQYQQYQQHRHFKQYQLQQEQQQQKIFHQHFYQPVVYTNQLKTFYEQNNYLQLIQPPVQQHGEQLLAQIDNQLQSDLQLLHQRHEHDKSHSAVDDEGNATGVCTNEAEGNPIPSLTSVWRRASSDSWCFGNKRTSNVELIPGNNCE